ncbi:terminase large subunit domain-containing protein [Bacillus cereus]|uniref:terminase large subunit domain-containing protein n=1 Tax=Bacillus cereus TaxID=1396 RepID=UPI0039814BB4
MIKYPLSYNPILEYWYKIKTKKEVVSDKVRRVYKKLVTDLSSTKSEWEYNTKSEWEYNTKRANHAIEFIENFCKHSKGKMGGKPFLLELWQKAMTAALFGFVHKIDGVRKYREFILIVARKNGKSAWGSAIALYMMVADGEPGPEIVSAATKKDQAKIIWSEAKRMVKKSPVLSKRIRALVAEMISNFNDGSFKPLSSDSNTLDGLNVHCSLIDELHAIEDKNLYDVIVDGMTAREQPISVITTTAGTVREGIFDIKYEEAERIINGYDDPDGYEDERVLPIIYELDKREEWVDESCWKKANPGLSTIKNFDQLRSKVEKAKANPLLVKNLLTKDFNINEVKRGKKYTYSAHFRCAILNGQKVTAAPSLRVISVEGIRVLKQYPAPSTDGKIVRYAVTFTVPDDYDENNGFCYFDIFGGGELSKNQSCVVGGVQLVEGETPCMYNWDMSYEQMVNGLVPFSGFALGDVNNSYIYENGRNKIFNITSQGEGETLRVLGNTHSFISWWNASGRYAWMGLGQSGASRFTINTDRPVAFSNQVEINGINIGGGAYGSPGSMNYYNGAKGWGFYVHDGAWRYLNY